MIDGFKGYRSIYFKKKKIKASRRTKSYLIKYGKLKKLDEHAKHKFI